MENNSTKLRCSADEAVSNRDCVQSKHKTSSEVLLPSALAYSTKLRCYMSIALELAQAAYDEEEVPVGCVIVLENEIIGRGYNRRNTAKNALHHAEMLAISEACAYMGDWRLENTTLYVTVEPCAMCAGAIVNARVPVVVYGCANPKAGCAGSILDILNEPRFNHRAEVISGVMEEECARLMSEFFARRR